MWVVGGQEQPMGLRVRPAGFHQGSATHRLLDSYCEGGDYDMKVMMGRVGA